MSVRRKMYSPSSPVLSSFDSPLVDYQSNQCLKFKYFTTFLICTTSLALLSASLATHKWIVAKPIRILKINGGQTNFSSFLTFDNTNNNNDQRHHQQQQFYTQSTSSAQQLIATAPNNGGADQKQSPTIDNKFQGEIFFGLFNGVKVLNYGFGDRISQISGFSCLSAITCWLIEYFMRLKKNVLTVEEVQNGWSSENRSQFGYSYYLVVTAFVLYLINIFIVSLVQYKGSSKKRKARAVCEGVIMLY